MRGRALLCLLLVMSLGMGAVPASGAETTTSSPSSLEADVFTVGEVTRDPAPAEDPAAEEPEPAPAGERVELVERRTASTATFQLPDGSFELVQSAGPVHYRDPDGAWQPIDTALVAAQVDGVAGWRNAANGFAVFLPEQVSTAAGVRLSAGGHEIAMRMVDARGDAATLHARTPAARAEVAYATPFAGVEVEYASVPTGVKETVVLDSPAAGSVFRFALDLSTGLAVDTVDGQVVVVDAAGTVVAEFGAPFMVDTSGDPEAGYSDAVTLTVVEQSPGGALLELAADAAWLGDAARVFPVRIDPTVTLPDAQGVTDAYISQASPSTNYGSADTLLVSRNSAGEETRGLVRWNENPAEVFTEPVVVREALLRLWTLADAAPDAIPAVGVHRLKQSFNSSAVTWTHRTATDTWDTAGGTIDADPEYVNTTVSEATAGWAEFAVTELTQDWVDGEVNSRGLLVDWADPATGSVQFASNSYTDSSKRPQLVINYSPLIGVRDAGRYQTFDLTDRRQALVDLASGNLTVRETDVSIAGTGLPFTVERFYNSRWYSTRGMGRNWSMWPQDTAPMRTGYAEAKMWEGGPAGVVMFFKQPDGTWRSPHGVDATLTMDGSDELLRDNDSGTTLRFGGWDALESITDRNGNQVLAHHTLDPTGTFRYHSSFTDTQGRTISVDAAGNNQVTKVTDPAGRTHVYSYDTSGYAPVLTGYTDPAGKTTTYTYRATGDIGVLEAITDSEGNVTRFVYGSDGRTAKVIRVTDPVNGTGPTWDFDYSVLWQTTVTDPNGKATTHHYDRRGRITKVVDALGNEQATSYTTASNVASYTDRIGGTPTLNTYTSDGLNNLTSTQTPTGASTTFGYTDPDNPYAPSTMTTPQGNSVVYDYDAAGNLATITDAQSQCVGGCATTITRNADGTVASTTDARGNTTTFGYDTFGNQTSIDPPGTTIGVTTIGYDGLSRPTSITDGNGHTTTIGYDILDRPTLVTYHDNTQVARTYDTIGNMTSQTDAGGTKTIVYDELNRITSETLPGNTTTSYAYDDAGNLTTLTDASGTTTYAYNAVNLLTSLTEPGGNVTAFGYDDANNRTSTSYPNGVTQTAAFDASNRLTQITGATATSVLTDFVYSYLKPGTTGDTALRHTVTDAAGHTTTYGYDTADRLISAVTRNSGGSTIDDRSYGYDAASNRISDTINGTGTSATFNAANQLTARGSVTYTYDGAGQQTGTSTGQQLVYNTAAQTTSMQAAGGSAVTAAYAGVGQFERTSIGADTFATTILGVTSRTPASGTAQSYTRDANGSLVGLRQGTTRSYYLFDGLGSVAALTDSGGAVTHTYDYDPYGQTTETRPTGSSIVNPWRYTGEYHDTTTGLYKIGARYYQPDLGRWTQPDPIDRALIVQGPANGTNYTYGGCNPINNTDPTGLLSCGTVVTWMANIGISLVCGFGCGIFFGPTAAALCAAICGLATSEAGFDAYLAQRACRYL